MSENEKLRVRLAVAYEIIAKIHVSLCDDKSVKFAEDTLEILRAILRLEEKLEGGENNADCS